MCSEGAEDSEDVNANQIGNVSHHHITAWRYSIIAVPAANFENVYKREGRREDGSWIRPPHFTSMSLVYLER